MGRFFNPDNSAFLQTLNSKIYVDKTELIDYTNNVLNSEQAFICNSRPRRFGKSITANMLSAYYSKGCDSRQIFENLKIEKSESFSKNLNKYNVIHLDLQWCTKDAGGPENVIAYINKTVVDEMRNEYGTVLAEENLSLYSAISRIYEESKEKFVIIIDECDALIRDNTYNERIPQDYIDFLSGMFKGTEPTRYLSLVYLTGILPIKRMKTQSVLNNFDEYTMLSAKSLAPYIGFTEEEVRELCEKYNRDFSCVKQWYDGYILANDGAFYSVYNPKAVVNVMLWGEFQSYWSQTGSFETIEQYINRNIDGLKDTVIAMLSGDDARVNVTLFRNDLDERSLKSKEDILTFLIHLGYLAYNPIRKTVYIPNEEIRQEFVNATADRGWSELQQFENESSSLLEVTLDMDTQAVADKIETIHMQYVSTLEYNDENSLSSVLSIAYLSSMRYYFRPVRELPTGRGYADYVYIPKPEYIGVYPAMLVELKWNKSAETALNQIKEKRYPESLLQYTGEILLVGINYDKKTKCHECKIEEYKKEV